MRENWRLLGPRAPALQTGGQGGGGVAEFFPEVYYPLIAMTLSFLAPVRSNVGREKFVAGVWTMSGNLHVVD
jgi:hypothetical protein